MTEVSLGFGVSQPPACLTEQVEVGTFRIYLRCQNILVSCFDEIILNIANVSLHFSSMAALDKIERKVLFANNNETNI